MPTIERIPFTCTLDCGSRCELVACLRDGVLQRIDTPERQDTVRRPRLVPCARGRAHRRMLDVRERVRTPLRRTGPRGSGQFEPVSWEEALDEVAERLSTTRERYGPTAVLHATGAGSVSGVGISGSSASHRFFTFWDGVSLAAGNESNYNASMAAHWMLGGGVPASDRATLLDSRLILLWGMNPAENRMGPNTEYFVAEARDRGAHVVLIDPRLSDSGALADEWTPLRPGTDAALIAALVYCLERDNAVDQEWMATHTVGYPEYRNDVLGANGGTPRDPTWAADITGVPAERIEGLAQRYAQSHPTAILAGWGPQRARFGEQVARALITLACVGGNVGLAGGGLASLGVRGGGVRPGYMPRGPHRPKRHFRPGVWADALLDDALDPPIKMAYIVASNIINRTPDARRNAEALEQLDFVVLNEPFMTPTARYADLVLPVSIDMERPDLVRSWGYDSHLFQANRAVEPTGQARSDYAIFCGLAERLGFGEAYSQGRTEQEWVDWLRESSDLDREALQQEGIWRVDPEPRVALRAFAQDPVANPLPTPSGRIEIATAAAMRHGLPIIPTYLADDTAGDPRYPLQLLTPHSKLRSNSCLHANPWLQRLEPHRAWISPVDAAFRGIADGDPILVSSSQGTIALPVYVTERIMPGVICVYQGTWYAPDADGIDRGGCANTLTSQLESPSGGYATHTTWVQVAKEAR